MRYLICLDPEVEQSSSVLHTQSLLRDGDEVVLLSVYTEPDRMIAAGLLDDGMVATLPDDVFEKRAAAIRKASESIVAHFEPKFPGCDVVVKQSRDIRHTILEVAEQTKTDIIVLSARSQSAVARVLLGSVSQYVLHHFPTSVRGCMIVHEHHSADHGQNIVVAYDASPAAKTAMCTAVRLLNASRKDRLIVLVALRPPPETYADLSPFSEFAQPNPYYDEESKVAKSRAKAVADAGVKLAMAEGAAEDAVSSVVVEGRDVKHAIVEYADGGQDGQVLG